MTTQLQNELASLDEKILSTASENSENSENLLFPINCFPPTMKAMIEESSNMSSVPHAMAGMVALASISASIGGGICIKSTNGRTLKGNLHLLTVAKSGTGKGSVYSAVTAPLMEYNAEMLDNWRMEKVPELISKKAQVEDRIKIVRKDISKGEGNMDELLALQMELADLEHCLLSPPRLFVGETTEQALGIALTGQPHEALANFNPEARGLVQIILGKFGSGSDSTGETIYCAGYSGDPYSIERAGRTDLNLKRPCLSVLFMLQPDSMKKLTGSDSMNLSGFLPRFLMADVKADFVEDTGEDMSISAATSESWNDLLNDLLDFYRNSKTVMEVSLSSEASQLLRDESNRVLRLGKNGASLERLSSFVARYGENLRKVHLVLHVAEHGTKAHTLEAGAETARNAIQITRWFFQQMLEVLKQGMISKLQSQLDRIVKEIGKIKDGEPKEITLGVMLKSHSTTKEDIKELQYFFPNVLEVVDRKHAEGGRPTRVVRLVED